jgi:hypothetical protein
MRLVRVSRDVFLQLVLLDCAEKTRHTCLTQLHEYWVKPLVGEKFDGTRWLEQCCRGKTLYDSSSVHRAGQVERLAFAKDVLLSSDRKKSAEARDADLVERPAFGKAGPESISAWPQLEKTAVSFVAHMAQ